MGDTSERRRTPRAHLQGEASIELPDSETFEVRLLDIGVGGMALMGRDGAPTGYLRIRFKLGPQSGDFDVGGIVVSERQQEEHTIWGIKFQDVDLGTRVRLRDYVAGEQRRSGAFSTIPVEIEYDST